MRLEPNQICPHSTNCKYNKTSGSFCMGTNPSRKTVFNCDFINNDGTFIKEGKTRVAQDVTGRMEFLND